MEHLEMVLNVAVFLFLICLGVIVERAVFGEKLNDVEISFNRPPPPQGSNPKKRKKRKHVHHSR